MSTSAERMRRLRAREKEGKVRLTIYIPLGAIASLRRLGWLRGEAEPKAIRGAMISLIHTVLNAGDHNTR